MAEIEAVGVTRSYRMDGISVDGTNPAFILRNSSDSVVVRQAPGWCVPHI